MKVLPAEEIEPPRPDGPAIDNGRITRRRAQLVVAAGQYQAQSATPGMVVQTAIRVRIDEAVQVNMPAESPEEIVAL